LQVTSLELLALFTGGFKVVKTKNVAIRSGERITGPIAIAAAVLGFFDWRERQDRLGRAFGRSGDRLSGRNFRIVRMALCGFLDSAIFSQVVFTALFAIRA
jgi:hypothetical protein